MELFVHRRDVFAVQSPSGAYYPQRSKLTHDDIAGHLAGDESIGTYVIDPTDQTVKYVVFDLDTYDPDALEHLKWCVQSIIPKESYNHHRSLLLEESGGKGYHVWLLLSAPLDCGPRPATQFWKFFQSKTPSSTRDSAILSSCLSAFTPSPARNLRLLPIKTGLGT